MYYADKRSHKHAKVRRRVIWLSIILLLAATFYWISQLTLAPKQELRSSPPLSRKGNTAIQKKIVIQKPEFTMSLSSTWKETAAGQTATAPRYAFTDTQNSRVIEFFINNPPVNLALNRAIVVSGVDEKLAYDLVSGNCTAFTDANKTASQSTVAKAKWQEVDFLCDAANSSRAVVGTISKDGMNQFLVRLPNGVTYKVFIMYTDNNINPDYSVLYEILQSMQFR